jgi:hypothetical protein
MNPILILLGLFDAEDEGTEILQNVRNDSFSGTASHSRRIELSECNFRTAVCRLTVHSVGKKACD